MEFLIFLNTLISSNPAAFGSGVMTLIITAMIGWSLRIGKKNKEEADEKFTEILSSQEEMSREYREGFKLLNHKFEENTKSTEATLKRIEGQLDENKLMTLRGLVANTSLPREDRLRNYDEYLKLGGNSWLVDYVEKELLQEDKKGKE